MIIMRMILRIFIDIHLLLIIKRNKINKLKGILRRLHINFVHINLDNLRIQIIKYIYITFLCTCTL